MKASKLYSDIRKLKNNYKSFVINDQLLVSLNKLDHISFFKFYKIRNGKVFRIFRNKELLVPYSFVKKILKNDENALNAMISSIIEKRHKISQHLVYRCLSAKTLSDYKDVLSIISDSYVFYDMFIPNVKDKSLKDIKRYVAAVQSDKLDYSNTCLGRFVKMKNSKYFYETLTRAIEELNDEKDYPIVILHKKICILESYFLNFCEKRQDIIKFYRTLIDCKKFLKKIWLNYKEHFFVDEIHNLINILFQTLKKLKK